MFAWSSTLMALACATEIDFYSDDGLSLLQLRASAFHQEEQQPNCRYVEGTMENVDLLNHDWHSEKEDADDICTATPECVGIIKGQRGWGKLKDCTDQCVTLTGDGNRGITSVQEKVCSAVNDEAGAVGDPHVTLANGGTSDMCCENGHCEPCNSLHDSVTLGHTDENDDEQNRPHRR